MPLDARKVGHISANRAKITAGRSETVVLVSTAGGVATYAALSGCVWFEAGAVPAGITTRAGEITRVAYDALLEAPSGTVWPSGLRLVARTATANAAGVAAAERFTVLDKRRVGLGTTGSGGGTAFGNRWLVRLRRMR